MKEDSGIYTSPFLDTDEPKMALRARKTSGAFEKRAPGTKLDNKIIELRQCPFSPALSCFVETLKPYSYVSSKLFISF